MIICLSSSLPLGFLFLAEVFDSFSVLDYEVAYKSDKLGFLSIYIAVYINQPNFIYSGVHKLQSS